MNIYKSKPQIVSITLYPEQIARLNQMGINTSKYIRKLIDNDTLSNEEVGNLINEYKKEIARLENIRKKPKETDVKSFFSKEQKEMLKEAKKSTEKDKSFLFGRLSQYNNEFGQDLNTLEFKKLLDSI